MKARPIVVCNGNRFDAGLVGQLRARSDILFIQLEAPGVFQARRTGFEAVTSAFFAIHDDDDFLLPGALARRLAAIRGDDKADWVVTDGTFVWPDHEVPYIPSIENVRRDPFGTLLDHCMLVYGSGNADGNRHEHDDLPILVAGGGRGSLKQGRHLRYPEGTPLNNLWLSLLDRMHSPVDQLGDSAGRLPGLEG